MCPQWSVLCCCFYLRLCVPISCASQAPCWSAVTIMMKPVWLSLLWEEIHLSSGGKVFHDKPCCHVIIKLGSVYWLLIAIFSVSGSQEPVTKQFCFYLSRFWWVSCLFQNIYFHRASESYSASLFCIPMLICLSRWALACHLVLFFPLYLLSSKSVLEFCSQGLVWLFLAEDMSCKKNRNTSAGTLQVSPLTCQTKAEVLLKNLNQRNILLGEVEHSEIGCVMCHLKLLVSLIMPVYIHLCLYIYLWFCLCVNLCSYCECLSVFLEIAVGCSGNCFKCDLIALCTYVYINI